jgi:hypothetical protein
VAMTRPRILAAVALALVLFTLGRLSAPTEAAARARGYHDGTVAGYADGFRAGRAEGLQEGQATAETAALPPGDRATARSAFDAGYRAGANGAFSGYDGGWELGRPYVIVLAKGSNGTTYRIAARFRCPEPTTTTYTATPTSLLACQPAR